MAVVDSGCGGRRVAVVEGGAEGVAIGAVWVDGHGREWRTGDHSGDGG